MPFDDSYGAESQCVLIPLRTIDKAYGPDAVDDAGDDAVYCLRSASDYVDQYKLEFALDASHPNSWYHTVGYVVQGITRQHYERFVELLSSYGQVEG